MDYIYKETITSSKSYVVPESRLYRFHVVGNGGDGGDGGLAYRSAGTSYTVRFSQRGTGGGGGAGGTGGYAIHDVALAAGNIIEVNRTTSAVSIKLPNGDIVMAASGATGSNGGTGYAYDGYNDSKSTLGVGGSGGNGGAATGGNVLNLAGARGNSGSSGGNNSSGSGGSSASISDARAIYRQKSVAAGGSGTFAKDAGNGASSLSNTTSLGGGGGGGGGGEYYADKSSSSNDKTYSRGYGGSGGYGGVVIEVATNRPPTDPMGLFYEAPNADKTVAISWTASEDPDGDIIHYVVERRVDNGTYQQIAFTDLTVYNDICPTSGTFYQVRVKAVDVLGLESGWVTGVTLPICYNMPPEITGVDTDLGVITQPQTYSYTPSDHDVDDTLMVTEQVTNGTEIITIRSFLAENGQQYIADLSSVWMRLLNGPHTLMITVSDGNGGEITRTIMFNREVRNIAASRTFKTERAVKECYFALFPADRPADSMIFLEVSNNPFDPAPIWEKISAKTNREAHKFSDHVVLTPGLGYRFRIIKGDAAIEFDRVNIKYGY